MAATGYNVITTSDTISFRDGTTGLASIAYDHGSETLSISQLGTGSVSFGDTASDLYIGDGVNSVDLIFEVDGAVKGDTDVTLTLGATDSDILIASPIATLTGSQLATESWVLGQVVDSAPATLNTLNELAAALGDDANYSTTISTALGNRLRIDTASQGLSSTEQSNARTNLGLGSAATSNTSAFLGATAKAADSDKLDNLNSTQFLRSDASDSFGGANSVLTIEGVLRSTNNANANGPNFNVSTTNKDTNEYAYRVDRSGTVVGGIKINGDGVFAALNVGGVDVINSSGAWTGGVISSAKLDADTAHLSGGQTFTGTKAFNSSIVFNNDSTGVVFYADNALKKVNGTGMVLTTDSTRALDILLQFERGSGGTKYKAFHDGYHPNADTLTTARTITLAGGVTGNVSFNGSSDVSITTAVANNSHYHTIENVTNLQSSLNAKAPLASPTFTGTVTTLT